MRCHSQTSYWPLSTGQGEDAAPLLAAAGRCPVSAINTKQRGSVPGIGPDEVRLWEALGNRALSNQPPISSGQGWEGLVSLSSLSLSEMLCINILYIKKKSYHNFSLLKEVVWNWN